MKQIVICFLLLATLATSKSIPELYTANGGQFTTDYAAKYTSTTTGEFGFSTEAGDINNDGITDFIIADPFYDSNKGIVYVIYGKKGTLRQIPTMNDFTSSDGFIIKGAQAEQRLGFALGSAGDVNGDGIDDIIIGSWGWRQDNSNTDVGVTYVIFGRKSSSEFPLQVDAERLSSTQGFRMYGEAAKHMSGYSASGAGDINGDGIADVMVGAIGAKSEWGKVYVVFGKKSGWGDIKFPPAAGTGFTVEGSSGDHFGNSVSKVGDFNGDGLDDVIIGAHCADNWRGRAYVLLGRRNPQLVIPSNFLLIIFGYSSYNNFGATVSGIGDFNGDGLMDVAVGAFAANGGRGAAYVILGMRKLPYPESVSMDIMSSSQGFSLSSSSASTTAQIGLFVSGGRDLNGDGLSDLIVSAPGLNNNKGAVYVIYGSQQSSFSNVALDSLSSSKGYIMHGLKEGDRFGAFIKPLKDVNQDGVPDLLIGAYGSNNKQGSAYVFYLPWKCASNCECSKPDTCDSCSSGYGFLNGNCVSCPSTHTLSNGNCVVKCPSTCQSCSSSGVCNVCASGYGFLNGNCVSCPSTHTLSNGNCIVKCPSNCQSCSSSGVCNTCVYGYGFLNGVCVICPADTHVLSSGSCKIKCSENCAQCSQPNTCDSCSSGYGFLNGACVVCPATTHTLSNGYCKPKCSENCQSCSQPNTCDTCSPGYGFLNGACTICPSNTHSLSNGFCLIKCASNCQSCSQPNTCDNCAQGYGFLNGDCIVCPWTHSLNNGACKANCPANCEQCSDSNKCDACNQGYGFLDGKCVTCPASTHVLSNGYCFIKCSENCSKCSEPNKCDVCLSGFGFLDDEECSLCPATTHFLNNGYCIEFQDKFQIIKDFFGLLFGR